MLIKRTTSPFHHLQNEVDKLFNQFDVSTAHWMPEVDIVETDGSIILQLECAGLSRENIDLSVENNELTIKGEKTLAETNSKGSYHLAERRYGSFTRTFKLPVYVDTETISASFDNGVLIITVAKKESIKARKVEITSTPQKELASKAAR